MTDPERIFHMMWNYRKQPTCLISFMMRDTTLCNGHGYGREKCEFYNEFGSCTNRHYTSNLK